MTACESEPMYGVFEVVLFSYLDRPIFDVRVNGFDIGGSSEYPITGGGSMVGVSFKLGPQKISWRYTDTGVTVIAKNSPVLDKGRPEDEYLAVHVLPDDTAELTLSPAYPDFLPRGVELAKVRGGNHE
jgi:hypothetical protein